MSRLRAQIPLAALLLGAIALFACSEDSPTGGTPPPPPSPGQLNQTGAWMWANPAPQGAPIIRMEFASTTTIFAITYGGSVMKSVDAGSSWEVAYDAQRVHAEPTRLLRGLFFLDHNLGWVVGGAGQVTMTSDGGETWHDRSTGQVGEAMDVFFHDSQNGFVVNTRGKIFRTTDGGLSWSEAPHLAGDVVFNVVEFSSVDVGWVAGDDGRVLRTEDGGASWQIVSIPWTDDFTSSCVAGSEVVFGTEQGAVIKSDGAALAAIQRRGSVSDVHFSSPDNGYALFYDGGPFLGTVTDGVWSEAPISVNQTPLGITAAGSRLVIGGWHGIIYHSNSGGATWERGFGSVEAPDIFARQFTDVDIDSTGTGLAVGFGGILFRTDDNGLTWDARESGVTVDLNAVSIVGQIAIAVGMDATVIRSTDGGLTWSPVTVIADGRRLMGVDQWDESSAIVVGYATTESEAIFTTVDGGVTWIAVKRTAGPFVTFLDVDVHGTDTAFLGGGLGVFVSTTDGGTTWDERDTGSSRALHGVNAFDDMRVWCTTQSQDILRSVDGGVTWASTRALASVWEVAFGTELVGVGVGPTGGTVSSIDGGATWTLINGGIDGWAHARAVCMTSPTDGVLVGTESKILYTRSAGRFQ